MMRKLFLCTTVCLFLSNTTFANDADLCISNFESKSYTDAFRYCEKACNLDNGLGCSVLGVLYAEGKGVRQDYQQAKTYFEKACNLDEVRGCFNLGVLYCRGDGVRQDYQQAKTYYEKACNLDEGQGCYNLGVLYENGQGVRQDYQQAITYFEKACNLDDGIACNALGNSYSLKCLAIEDPAYAECCIEDKSRQIIQSIPDFKNEASCHRESKEYYGKACDLGEQKGCDKYRELNEQGY